MESQDFFFREEKRQKRDMRRIEGSTPRLVGEKMERRDKYFEGL